MATDTAALPSTAATTDSTRHLWQVPVLLLGIGVFVCEWQGWIPIHAAVILASRSLSATSSPLKTGYEG